MERLKERVNKSLSFTEENGFSSTLEVFFLSYLKELMGIRATNDDTGDICLALLIA